MTLLGRMAAVHIINATPRLYKRQIRMWPFFLAAALLLILLGKLT